MVRAAAALLLTLVLAAPCLGAAAQDQAWLEVLEGISRDLDRRQAEVDAVGRELPGLLAESGRDLAASETRLTQALILRGVAGRSPWTLRTLLVQYRNVAWSLDHGSQRLRLAKEYMARVGEENAALRDIRRMGIDSGAAAPGGGASPERKLEAMRAVMEGLNGSLDQAIGRFDALKEKVAQAAMELREDYIQVFKEHFFQGSRPPLDEYGLILLVSRSADWTNDFPRFLASVAALTNWGGLLLAGLPLWAGLLLAGRAAAVRLGSWGQASARLGWALMTMGLAFYAATYLAPFTGSHFLNLLLVLVFVLGAAILARRHVRKGNLDFLLTLYAAGTLLQFTAVPAETAGVAWAAVMGLASVLAWRKGERGRAWWLVSMGALALSGFGPLSVALVQAWFLLRLTAAGSRALGAVLQGRGAVWSGYVHPLLVTVMAVAYVSWVLLFMGGPGFVDYVFTLEWALGPVKFTLDAAALMALLFFAARLLLAWLDLLFERGRMGGRQLDPALGHTLSTLASYVVWVAWLLAALTALGLPLSGVTWIASGLSVGVGFGLKDIINNFVSGLIILFGGSIKKGDVVQTGKTLGEVTAVSVRNTTVRTMDNSMVIIPNSSFLKGEIINWSYQDKRIRLTIPVSVAPGTKIKKVRKILLGVAKDNELVLKDPAPSVALRQFGRYGLDFEVYVWIEDFRDKFKVESDLATAMDQSLQENKITVAFQGIKIKYKPKGSQEAQLEAAREALMEKRRQVFALVRPLRRVHMRSRWGVPAAAPPRGEE